MRTIIRALTITMAILLPLVVTASQHLIAEALEMKGHRFRLEGDFSAAKQIEAKLISEFDEPIGHTFALNTIVTHLTWDETVTDYDQDLIHHASETLLWCNAELDQNSNDAMAHYYCGQAHFSLSLLHGLRNQYYRSGKHGTSCIDHLEAALALDPKLVDAKTYLGLTYYVADNLPPFIKMFSRILWFVPTGNSEKSLPYLLDVIENGRQLPEVARYIYSILLMEGDDRQKSEAETHLQFLVDHYPGNSRFQLKLISLLLIQAKFQQTLSTAMTYLNDTDLEPPGEPDLSLVKIWMARAYLGLDQVEQADQLYRETDLVFESTGEQLPGWSIAWHMLTGGQLHDLADRRNKAQATYAEILNISKSTYMNKVIIDAARKGLLSPYSLTP